MQYQRIQRQAATTAVQSTGCRCLSHAGLGRCDTCRRLDTRVALQRRLTNDADADRYEDEANQAADALTSAPRPSAYHGRLNRVQPSDGLSIAPEFSSESARRTLAEGGADLPPDVRLDMEGHFGHDFSKVRVHAGPSAQHSARDLHADAYTIGQHVAFGAERYSPSSWHGRWLIAHELAHVVQQSSGEGQPSPVIQRNPEGSKPKTSGPALVDKESSGLAATEAAMDLSLDLLLAVPLTSEEMYQLLLIRRAEPLSIPASMVNEAPSLISETDKRIADVDRNAHAAGAELAKAKAARSRARGNGQDVIRLQIQKLEAQAKGFAAERKRLLAQRISLVRGQRLSTIGQGAAAGTGQITYAVIQVVDATGKRIALEFNVTSATEHAEERIVRRLRETLSADQLRGAKITVVGDQVVCSGRCKPVLSKFAKDYGIEVVQAHVFTRPRADRRGQASPRTTLRTATQPVSENLPVAKTSEEIYRRPPGKASLAASESPSIGMGVDLGHLQRPGVEPDTTDVPRSPTVEVPTVPLRARARSAMVEVAGNLIVDLVLDLLIAKYQQWRNDVNLRERLQALQPQVLALM